jgi:hypothetical protein
MKGRRVTPSEFPSEMLTNTQDKSWASPNRGLNKPMITWAACEGTAASKPAVVTAATTNLIN